MFNKIKLDKFQIHQIDALVGTGFLNEIIRLLLQHVKERDDDLYSFMRHFI